MIRTEMMPIGKIFPCPTNARKNDVAVDAVAQSISLFGFTNPILVDSNGEIIAGHARYKAALKLGLKKVPVIRRADLSEIQVRAFRLADNKTGELARWDYDLLGSELSSLKDSFNFELLGFGRDEFRSLTDSFEVKDVIEDEYSDQKARMKVKLGDVFRMGRHLLACCGNEDPVVDEIMGGNRARCAFSEPSVDCLGETMKRTCGAVYYAFDASEIGKVKYNFEKLGGHFSTFLLFNHSDGKTFTPILYGWNEGEEHWWCGDRNQGDVWNASGDAKGGDHDRIPVEIVARAIKNSSLPGDTVLDLCAGSGTLAIACEQSGRCAVMAEPDPENCSKIVQRWEKFTGKKAKRACFF